MRTVKLGLEREVEAHPVGAPSLVLIGCSQLVPGLRGALEASEVNFHTESPIPNLKGRG